MNVNELFHKWKTRVGLPSFIAQAILAVWVGLFVGAGIPFLVYSAYEASTHQGWGGDRAKAGFTGLLLGSSCVFVGFGLPLGMVALFTMRRT